MTLENKELILRINNFEKSFGGKVLFEKSNLNIHVGDKITLLGQNGVGKTTFVRCVIGEEDYYGDIELTLGIRLAMMEQEKSFENSPKTFSDYLEDKKSKLLEKQAIYEAKFADPKVYEDTIKYEKLLLDYGKIQSRCETNIDEIKIKEILTELGFEMEDYDKPIYSLSGGQKIKLRLAEITSRDADFFILDEPTNHLDFNSINWLENRIKTSNKSFLIISHDRHFVNLISNRIIEIEEQKFENYDCTYNNYVIRRKNRHEALKKKFDSVDREKKRLKKSEEEKRKWAHLVGSKKMKIQADNIKRRSDNLGEHSNPDDFNDNYTLKFLEGSFSGNNVFKGTEISKKFGELEILKEISFCIENKERIVILGKNGCGKSTLLKMFALRDTNYEGTLKFGSELKIGYLDQEFKDLNPKQTVMNFLWEADQNLMEHHIISYLIKFGFEFSRINDKIEKLSGGEKTRISLVKLMLSKYDVLLLDEPTNNLDIELIESLETALNEFNGTIVFVSHDRRFIDKVAKKIFIIKNKTLEILDGNYKRFSK